MPSVPELQDDHVPMPLALDRERLRVLLYGEYGRGKSTLAGSFPKPLIIDTNGGLKALALSGVVADTFVPTGHEDLEALYYWIKERSADYETIVIDTLDSLTALLMDEITDDAVSFKTEDRSRRVSLRMRFVPEQGDYYASQRQMRRFLTDLRRLGKHIVITSGQRTEYGTNGPDVSKGMSSVVRDWADIVGELVIIDDVDDDELPDGTGDVPTSGCRLLWTDEANGRSTKARFNRMKPYIVEPTFEKISALIEAEYRSATNGGKTADTGAAGRNK